MVNKKSVLAFATVFAFAFSPVTVKATPAVNTASPNVLIDEFDSAFVVPDQTKPWDYWYKMLIGADSLGYYRLENLNTNVDCNQEVCVRQMTENGIGFARLEIGPQQYPSVENVRIAQISDQRDSFSFSDPHRWLPTVGHPVEYSIRFRASSTYKADASGSAVGNWGFMLFNYSDYYPDQNADVSRDTSAFTRQPENTYLLGFSWTDSQTLNGLLTGLNAVAADKFDFLPAHLSPIRNININDWVNLKMKWEVNLLGIQTVTFYVNNQIASVYVPLFPMPAMGMFLYNDNERFVLGPGGLEPSHVAVPATQYVDLDRVEGRVL